MTVAVVDEDGPLGRARRALIQAAEDLGFGHDMRMPDGLHRRGRPAGRRLATVGAIGALLLGALPALAGEFTPTSQLRSVLSETTDATTGYTCLAGGPGPPLPGCPIDLGTTTTQDTDSAPGYAPFDATAATAGGVATQTSSMTTTNVLANGTGASSATATELTDPCCIFVLQMVDPETQATFEVTVDLDTETAFTFEASGWVEHPDPNFPVIGSANLDITLVGPPGQMASLNASFDPACSVSPEFGVCRVEPAPISLSGSLPAGSYTIEVHLDTSAQGNWLPSTGTLPGFANGAYEVSLALEGAPPVPALGGVGSWVLSLLLLFAGWVVGWRSAESAG